MARINWDQDGERLYETGVSRGVLYLKETTGEYGEGVAWNGLSAANSSPDGAEPTDIFADNIKYLSLMSAENHNGTIEAYTYPDEFAIADGSYTLAPGLNVGQQSRREFGLSYSSILGNDIEEDMYGEKIHLVYGAKASPSARDRGTVNDTPEAVTFSWEYTTTPVVIDYITVNGKSLKPSAYLEIDSTKVSEEAFAEIKGILYGTTDTEPRLPHIAEVLSIMSEGTLSSDIQIDKDALPADLQDLFPVRA